MSITGERYFKIPARIKLRKAPVVPSATGTQRQARTPGAWMRVNRTERVGTPTFRDAKPAQIRLNTSDITAGKSQSIGSYTQGKLLGTGAYATVRLAVNKESGAKVALKTYDKHRLLEPHRKKSV
jgi:serine/threonine protein kinase